MIKVYRKIPVEIEALQWMGFNSSEMIDFCGSCINNYLPQSEQLIIKTLEGQHIASVGDYIIKGIKGEFYPCKPDIFKLTYEEVLN